MLLAWVLGALVSLPLGITVALSLAYFFSQVGLPYPAALPVQTLAGILVATVVCIKIMNRVEGRG